MSTTNEANTLHPFFDAGMGEGPYTLHGVFDLGEAMNPNTAANFGNMTGWLKDAPKLESGMGTCTCCGKGISIICIVQNAAGKRYGVGSDCVEKADHQGICRKGVEAAMKIRNRAKNRARAEAKRKAAWDADKDRREARIKDACVRDLAEQRERYLRASKNTAVIDLLFPCALTDCTGRREADGWGAHVWLDDHGYWFNGSYDGGFRASILASLLNGTQANDLPDRAKRILTDIFSKSKGRGNSKAYQDAVTTAWTALNQPAA